MKLVTAIVRPERLDAVKQALFASGVRGITISSVSGHGGQGGRTGSYRGRPYIAWFHEKVQLTVAVSDAFVDATIEAIVDAARTGNIGDGKIFVQPLERVVRIRTRERDDEALTPIAVGS